MGEEAIKTVTKIVTILKVCRALKVTVTTMIPFLPQKMVLNNDYVIDIILTYI
jgi:hypothetical protein